MNPFYKLNETLANIGNEQKQIAKEVAKVAEKTPARKTLEESLRSDMKSLMEGTTPKTLKEGSMKDAMWRDAERMSREQFCAKWGDENCEFWDNISGDLDEATLSTNSAPDFDPQPGDIISDTIFGKVKLLKVTEKDTYGQFAAGIVKTKDGRTLNVTYEALIGNDEVAEGSSKNKNLVKYSVFYDLVDVPGSNKPKKVYSVVKLEAKPEQPNFFGDNPKTVKKGIQNQDEAQAIADKLNAQVAEDGTGGMNFSGSGSMEEAAGTLFTPQDIKAALDYKNPAGHIYTIANGKIRFNLMNMDRNALNKILSRPLQTQQDWDALKKQMRSALTSQLNEVKTKYGVCIVGHNGGKPVKTFDTEAEAQAYADKGIRVNGKLLQGSVRTMVGETDYSAKKAAAGKDIGKPGKNFAKIAKSSGGGEKGQKIAGAVLAKLRAAHESVKEASADMDEGNAFSGAVAKAKADGIQKGETIKVDGKTYPVKEQGAGGIHGSMPDPMTQKDQQKKMNPPRSLEEKDYSDEDIMDYLNRKLAPHDKQQQAKEDAVSKPYNGPADAADAYNGMWGTGMDKDLDEDTMEESVSRKHFQQVADLLKNIPDEAKRKEMALHHASIFKQQNPRFDIRRFAQAAGVDLEECAMWEELKGGQVKLDKNHNGKLDANDFAMLRGDNQETDEGWDDAMAAGKAAANQKPQFSRHDVKDTGYSKVYTRKPETFDEPEDGEADANGPKRGRGRPATGKAPNRKTKGAYKHKMEEEGEEMVDEKAEQGKRHFFDKLAPAAKKVAQVVSKVTAGKEDKKEEKKKDKKEEKSDKKSKKTEGAKPDFLDVDKDGDKKETMKKAAKDKKEEKVDETTTSGSVATATTSGKSSKGGINYGGSIYDSWNRQFETLLAESVNVSQEATKMEDGNEEEAITINVTGDDVARFKEVLASMGLGQQAAPGIEIAHDDSCGTCGGTPCQCDEQLANANGATMTGELDEADVTVSQNEPDYPSNEEESDDALQYSGGLNGPKSTGQTTIPVVASQEDRLHTMEESVDSFLSLYQSFKTK